MTWIIFLGIYIFPVLLLLTKSVNKLGDGGLLYMSKDHTTISKGLAILCVMLSHYMGHFGSGVTYFTPLGGTGVAAFLILSGYGLNESWKKRSVFMSSRLISPAANLGKGYFEHRILNVFVPYFLLETMLLPLRLGIFGGLEPLSFLTEPEFGIKEYLLDITLIRPLYSNGWFLTYIAMWYLIFYFVMRISDKLSEIQRHLGKTVKWVMIGVSCIVVFVFCREIWAEQALSFAIGMLISDIKDTKRFVRFAKTQDWKISLTLFAIATIFLALKQTAYIREAPQIVMKMVQLMIKLPYGYVVVMLPFLLNRIKLLHKLVERADAMLYSIGTISFEFYLIHGYVLSGCGKSVLAAAIWIVLTMVISAGFAWINKRIKKYIVVKIRTK